MASVRLCYRGAVGLLLLLLIIISGSVEGIERITTYRLVARQKTNACLAAILAFNSREAFALLKLVKPSRASCKLKPDGTVSYIVQFVAEEYLPPHFSAVLVLVTGFYTLPAASVDPLGNVDGNALIIAIDLLD